MEFPEDLRYTKDHEWVRVEGDQATVGVTDFAAHQLGDVQQAAEGHQHDRGGELCPVRRHVSQQAPELPHREASLEAHLHPGAARNAPEMIRIVSKGSL